MKPSLSPQAADPLAQLKDIHLPEPISWWPLAPGWWLLTLGILAILSYGLYRLWQSRKQNRYRRQALGELERHYASSANNPELFSQQILTLLRRTAEAAWPSQQLAAKPTETFLTTIGNHTENGEFSLALRQQLAVLPYQKQADYPADFTDDIYRASRQWIKNHHRKSGNRGPQC